MVRLQVAPRSVGARQGHLEDVMEGSSNVREIGVPTTILCAFISTSALSFGVKQLGVDSFCNSTS